MRPQLSRTSSRPKSWKGLHAALWLSSAFAVVAIGCSENPMSSQPVTDQNSAMNVDIDMEGGGGGATPEGEPSVTETTPAGDLSMTKKIRAAKGGKITVGRHVVTFAPGALLQDTRITVVDVTASAGRVQCELYPEGLHFHARVTLQSEFADRDSPNGYSMYWLNDESEWVNIGGRLSKNKRGIIATLEHFSTYRPGKEGPSFQP